MKRFAPALVLVLAALGCIEREEEYTINPDGSGKVKVSWVSAPSDFFMARGGDDADEMVKKVIGAQLSRAQGIDCWKDVTYSLRDDGKIAFRGTAYFKELGAVNLYGPDRNPLALSFSLDKNDKGNLVLAVKEISGGDDKGAKPSDDEVKKEMKKLRMKYQMVRPAI